MKRFIILFVMLIGMQSAYSQTITTKYVISDSEYRLEERMPCGKLVQTVDCESAFKTWRSYYENGKLQTVGYTINGKRIGKWRYYSPEGELTMTLTFKDNKLIRYEKRFEPERQMIAAK